MRTTSAVRELPRLQYTLMRVHRGGKGGGHYFAHHTEEVRLHTHAAKPRSDEESTRFD